MQLEKAMQAAQKTEWQAGPFNQIPRAKRSQTISMKNPANQSQVVGVVLEADTRNVDHALAQAKNAHQAWDRLGVKARAAILNRMADLLETHMPALMALISSEAGRVVVDTISEVREAVDFCRYYAEQARQTLMPRDLPGPTGESNQLFMQGRGTILCISPWNFPVAIFTGQIAAALVTGNCVIAKPAEQTPLTAAKVIELFYQAGIPQEVLQLLPGSGEKVGGKLVADERINGVMFTGSTATAKAIQKTLANRAGPIVPFIAETGGLNAMIADSTALPEQLVADVVASAFGSAGQRCSALRLLFVQDDIADKVITMLKGAMQELNVGDPGCLATDVGPVIDAEAKAMLLAHQEKMMREAKLIYQVKLNDAHKSGHFFAPQAYELDKLTLQQEVFGPILHVLRYRQAELDQVIQEINQLGYGLTFGVQSRIETSVDYIQQRIEAGNVYVNRNIIGAVVGVQPFGGSRLSGTGPKAGGPHYLARLCEEKTLTINTTAAGGNASLMSLDD